MLYIGILSLLTALTSGVVYANNADTTGCDPTLIFCNPLKYNSIGELILKLVDGITVILMPVIVLAIAYIGFRMVLAGKDKNAEYGKWKDAFAWSLVGLFLVLGARGILFVIQNTVNEVLGDEYQVDVVDDIPLGGGDT